MPKFVTIGYGDQRGYDRIDDDLKKAAHRRDAEFKEAGFVLGVAGLPVQVTNHAAGQISTYSGSFMSSSLPVAGFAIIEAEDLRSVIDKVAETSCAIAYGLAEAWPLIS